MNEGCSGIEINRILEPEHPFSSSKSDVMTNIAAHTFSSEGSSELFDNPPTTCSTQWANIKMV